MVTTAVEITSKEQQREAVTSTPARRTLISIWYSLDQAELVKPLDQHIQLLNYRMERPYTHDYYGYHSTAPTVNPNAYDSLREQQEKSVEEYQRLYNRSVANLARAAIFVPCVTPHFLTLLYKDIERNTQLKELLAQPELIIVPLLLEPTNGVEAPFPTPLTAYEGYERIEACRRFCERLEQIMYKRYPESKPVSRKETLPASLFRPAKKTVWLFR